MTATFVAEVPVITSWTAVIWPLVLISLVATVPGVVVALAAGLRTESVWGVAPALSLGVLAVATILGAKLGLGWGLAAIGLTTAVVAALALAIRLVGRRFVPWSWASPTIPHPTLAGLAWYAAGLAAAAAGAVAMMVRGLGTPDAINQTYDAPFHVNAIEIVAARHLATPDVVATASAPAGPPSFYPPLFHGLGGLAVDVTGVDAITAANLVATVIAAVIWPASIAFLVRTIVGPSRLAHAVAMIGAVLVSCFPQLLLTFGVLWPNALSLSVVPAVVALGAQVLRVAPEESMPPTTAAGLAVLTLPGLYYAHPGAAFVVMFLAAPLLVASWARFATFAWSRGNAWRGAVVLIPLLGLAGAAGLGFVLRRIPSLMRVRSFTWPSRARPAHAIGEVVALGGGGINPDFLAYGALVLIGAVVALRTRLWWVTAAHVVLGTLAVLAIAYDTRLSQLLTGFWYNDPWRILGPIPTTAIPLAAIGALAWRDAWRPWFDRAGRARTDRSQRGTWAASGVVLAIILVLIPGLTGIDRLSTSLAGSYGKAGDKLVSPGEEQLYRGLAADLGPGETITGNPWSGVVYAGVLSGRETLWNHIAIVPEADRTLLARRFKDFTTDPAVCAAVKRLHVGVVVEDTDLLWAERDNRPKQFPGMTDLAGTPGLSKIGSADTVTAYAVGDCRS